MLIDELPNGRQLVTAKPTVRRQRHRIEPVLRVTPSMGHMDVWRFLILQTIEEESVTAYPQQGRHTNSLLPPHTGEECLFGLLQGRDRLFLGDGREVFEELGQGLILFEVRALGKVAAPLSLALLAERVHPTPRPPRGVCHPK